MDSSFLGKSLCFGLLCGLVMPYTHGQVSNTGLMDTTGGERLGKVSIGGYIDAFYGFHSQQPSNGQVPYFVSMNRHNELTINLAYLDLRFSDERLRARFVPAFGTYMNANYAQEPSLLKHLVEASIGVKLSKKRDIWLEAGVFGSPYTNESAISRDHLVYTRSLAPEYVPYYLAGLRLSCPLGARWTGYVYLLNGWQQIQDQNRGKSLGTQLEFRPDDKHLLNWNTYLGDERSAQRPDFRMRYFTDVYWIYNPNGVWSWTSCAYVGVQARATGAPTLVHDLWWQVNAMGRYRFNARHSLSGRVEYFSDPQRLQIGDAPQPFRTASASLCWNTQIGKNAVWRVEARQFWSERAVFQSRQGQASQQATWLVTGLTAWF